VGAPFPMVVGLPYKVQKEVAGSGFPSSSSSEVVNFKHIRNIDLVYTSRVEANCLPPRVQASLSDGCVTALFMLFNDNWCEVGCLCATELLVVVLAALLLLAEALIFCDPVTKLSKEDPVAATLAPLVCALFQVDSGTVAMAAPLPLIGLGV
jgi:hypothetical protein